MGLKNGSKIDLSSRAAIYSIDLRRVVSMPNSLGSLTGPITGHCALDEHLITIGLQG